MRLRLMLSRSRKRHWPLRAPADYRVSILEVASSLITDQEVLEMELRWKAKLQRKEMGLNRN